jgi:transcriptional regulator with XRE-family HTH domain
VARPALNGDERRFAEELRTWRERRGLTKKALAAAMAYDPSRVSHVEAGRQPPTEEFARQAEAVLQTGGELWACWEAIAASRFGLSARPPERDLRTTEFIAWLADHSSESFMSLYSSVNAAVARMQAEPPSRRYARDHARGLVARDQLARAVVSYYGDGGPLGGFYGARVGDTEHLLSIFTRPEWLTPVDLTGGGDSFRYVPPSPAWFAEVENQGVTVALDRLALVEVKGTVMVNNPLYRLLDLELGHGRLDATVTTLDFAEHALTTELIEGELLGAIGASDTSRLPLRDVYLPSLDSVLALRDRACVGGAVSLFAAARRRPDGQRDYVIFVQERSSTVLNLAGKMAVVPKGFHQPTGEPANEAQLSVTLRRELEEELLGRQDLEQLSGATHHADLLHAQRLTEPMAWLLDRPDAFRMECSGFGFNLVTGNYEFACLIVVEDDEWWATFGHLVATNWEAERIHRYSSLDTEGLTALVADPRWGNESLFSLLQGLRRLGDSGEPARLALPVIALTSA